MTSRSVVCRLLGGRREKTEGHSDEPYRPGRQDAACVLGTVCRPSLCRRREDRRSRGGLSKHEFTNPDGLCAAVGAKHQTPTLGAQELRELGGRDIFRARFGLAEVDTTAPPPTRFHAYTETGDAEFFANKYAETLRYDHLRERWLLVDRETGIWVQDPIEHVLNLATDSIRNRQAIAATVVNQNERKEALSWTTKGESRSRLLNTLALAASKWPLADDGKEWDQDPLLLGCRNGVIDLRLGQVRRAYPEEKISMRVRVAYVPDAECPKWLGALAGIFASSDQPETDRVIAFMQRGLGYSLTGDCSEECCFFTWGEGSNGKGTIMNTIGWLLADYVDDMPYSTLEKTVRGGGVPNDVAKIAGKRFITCSEVNEFTINESRLKALTGRDPITARFLHKEFFTFLPVGKIWIATNNKPKIVGQDEGIWRRIHLIPFTNTFLDASNNKRLKDELREELEGILAWLVRGAMAWLNEGLNPPATVQVATQLYRRESDALNPFIESRLTVKDAKKTKATVLWSEYQKYCTDLHVEETARMSDKHFYRAMKRRFDTKEEHKALFFLGVVLGTRDTGY
jgi:putative DNA primase/helicase